MKLNILTLAAVSVAAMHVKSAAGEPLYADAERKVPVRILVHGPGSEAAGIVESRQTARALKRMADNDGKVTAATPEERRAETAADLATLTAGFENFDIGEGSLSGEALYLFVYSEPKLGFIAKQVGKFFGDWGNFNAASKAA